MNMTHRFNKLAIASTAAGMLALAGCATGGYGSTGAGYGTTGNSYGNSYGNTTATCYDCGVITVNGIAFTRTDEAEA